MEVTVLKSAADAASMNADLSWSFIEDGEPGNYGIFYASGSPLERNYDEEGQPSGWLFEERKAVVVKD